MATQTLYFTGKTKWCKVRVPDEKYETYQVPLYLDDKNLNLFKESGIQLKLREDSDGTFVIFKRKHAEFSYLTKAQEVNGPPEIKIKTNGKYVEFPNGLIGNGSVITVKTEVYDTPRRGAGTKGHRLIAVAVEELVTYSPPDRNDEASSAVVEMPF